MLFKIFKKEEQPDSEIFIDEDDWFSKASWFNSYFWDKLKDMLLNIIYSLYTSIEDKLLRKYFLEITFYSTASQYLDAFNKKNKTNHKGDFKCYLPLILKVKDTREGTLSTLFSNKFLIFKSVCAGKAIASSASFWRGIL